MLILAIDTASPHGSVAALRDGQLLDVVSNDVGDTHSLRFFGQMEKLLREQNLAMPQFDVFAVNGYLFSAFSQVATPTHYVLSDPACLDVRDAGAPSNRHLEISTKYLPLFNTLDTLNATLLVPMQYVSRQKSKRVIGFCDIENELSRNASDITKPRGYLSMTAYKALAIALFMGYDSIYICGFDNDYFQRLEADENNEAFYADAHFFGDPEKHSVKTEGAHVGEFLYVHHFLFSNFGKFPPGTIVNLHKASLNTFFSKKHDLDIYK